MSGGTYRVLRSYTRAGGIEVRVGDVVTLERAPRDPSFFEPVEPARDQGGSVPPAVAGESQPTPAPRRSRKSPAVP